MDALNANGKAKQVRKPSYTRRKTSSHREKKKKKTQQEQEERKNGGGGGGGTDELTDDSAQARGGCVALQPYRQVDVIVGQDSGRCQQLFGSQESRLTFVRPQPWRLVLQ